MTDLNEELATAAARIVSGMDPELYFVDDYAEEIGKVYANAIAELEELRKYRDSVSMCLVRQYPPFPWSMYYPGSDKYRAGGYQ